MLRETPEVVPLPDDARTIAKTHVDKEVVFYCGLGEIPHIDLRVVLADTQEAECRHFGMSIFRPSGVHSAERYVVDRKTVTGQVSCGVVT